MLFVFDPGCLPLTHAELQPRNNHMVVVGVLDECVVASPAGEAREPERRSLMTIARSGVGKRTAAAAADIVEHLVQGQAQMVPAFKVFAHIEIGAREVKSLR